MVDLDRRLAAIAVNKHSLVTLADVQDAGGGRGSAHRRVASGRWEQTASGVYRLAGVPSSYESRVMGAVLAAGPGAAASHLCAARLLGIDFVTAAPELSIPRGRRHRPEGIRVHQSTDLDRCEIQLAAAIPVTDPARTLLDLGRYIGPGALQRAVEQARRLELVCWSDLIRCLVTHARQGRHGIRRLRLVIADGVAYDAVTDTDSELLALSIIRERGLPEPVLHHRVYDAEGELLAELDLAYPERKAAVEIDGTAHLDPAIRRKDDARDHELRRRGWTIRRVWWEIPVRQPDQFARLMRDFLRDTEPTPAVLESFRLGLPNETTQEPRA